MDNLTYIGDETFCMNCWRIVKDWRCSCTKVNPGFDEPLPYYWVDKGIFVVIEEGE
jgi:hypothetical protein